MTNLVDSMSTLSISAKTHPWCEFYDSEPIKKVKSGPREMYSRVNLEHVQKFRVASKMVWVKEPRTKNEATFEKAEIRTSDELPHTPFAYYSVIMKTGNGRILMPVFNEIAADDRLDLKLVALNTNAQDTLNFGIFDANDHPIGDVICVTKLQRRQNSSGSQIEKFEEKDVTKPDGKLFWEVAEYFPAPRDLKRDVLASPFSNNKKRRRILCVAEKYSEVIEMSRRFGENLVNKLISATIFTPIIKPGQFLFSLKREHWRTVAKLSPKTITPNTYSPSIIEVADVPEHVKVIFENYNDAFRLWDRETAYKVVEQVVEFGSNGLFAIKNQAVDTIKYTTSIVKYSARPPYAYFCFSLIGATSVPPAQKWNRAVSVIIQSEDLFFYADVLSAQKNGKNLDVRARTSIQAFSHSMFAYWQNRDVTVHQRKEQQPCEINYRVAEGSSADQLFQALYGGAPLPPVQLPASKSLRAGEMVLLETQTNYARMVAEPRIKALIGSSSFGCGKTAAIAAAALHSHRLAATGKFQIVTAITNSAVVSLIEKLLQIDPSVGIIRIISAQNTTQLPSTQLTEFDYPTILLQILKDEDRRLLKKLAQTIPSETLQKIICYLKKKMAISEKSFTSENMKFLFKQEVTCNPVDIINFVMKYKKTQIIVGTVQSILNAFSTLWSSHVGNIATIQIDEASTLPRETLLQMISVFPNARYSLVGDYRQLSPYYVNTASELLIETAVGDTLRQCVTNNLLPSVYFNGVFRCRAEVTELLGSMFYDSTLQSMHRKSITESQLSGSQAWRLGKSNDYPIVFINTDGSAHRRRGTSLENTDERNSAIELARHLLKFVDKQNIAILCFYRAQVNELRDFGANSDIYVGSVDSAQGREWPICIICTTRTTAFADSEFMLNNNRINVALSRTKHMNFILGSLKSMHDAPNWKDVVEKCTEHGCSITSKHFNSIINPGMMRSEDGSDYDDAYSDGEENQLN